MGVFGLLAVAAPQRLIMGLVLVALVLVGAVTFGLVGLAVSFLSAVGLTLVLVGGVLVMRGGRQEGVLLVIGGVLLIISQGLFPSLSLGDVVASMTGGP